jgi:hypothetical protein
VSAGSPADGPPDRRPDGDRAELPDEPVTGAPAGAGTTAADPDAGTDAATAEDPDTGAAGDAGARRRRRLFLAAIAVGAALIAIACCAGGLTVVDAVSDFRHHSADARHERRLRDDACTGLETRLNRLVPPGATTTPQRRAVAIQDENAATRIYVAQLADQRTGDAWRQLLDARTAFAEDLEAQAKSRTPAFYVAPETAGRVPIAAELVRWSPAPCAGAIRRLAAPDL